MKVWLDKDECYLAFVRYEKPEHGECVEAELPEAFIKAYKEAEKRFWELHQTIERALEEGVKK